MVAQTSRPGEAEHIVEHLEHRIRSLVSSYRQARRYAAVHRDTGSGYAGSYERTAAAYRLEARILLDIRRSGRAAHRASEEHFAKVLADVIRDMDAMTETEARMAWGDR